MFNKSIYGSVNTIIHIHTLLYSVNSLNDFFFEFLIRLKYPFNIVDFKGNNVI